MRQRIDARPSVEMNIGLSVPIDVWSEIYGKSTTYAELSRSQLTSVVIQFRNCAAWPHPVLDLREATCWADTHATDVIR